MSDPSWPSSVLNAAVERGSLEKLHPASLTENATQLNGRVAVVTGGASGFGRAYCIAAARQGAKVVVSDINEAGAREVERIIRSSGGAASSFRADVTSWDAQVALFDHAIKTFGAVDIAVANAGVAEPLQEISNAGHPDKPDVKALDVNIRGVVYTATIALHHMQARPSAHKRSIVITGSMVSLFAIPQVPIYTASKHAVLGFMRSLSQRTAALGIDVSMVAPGFADTPLSAPFRSQLGNMPLVEMEDVADAMIAASTSLVANGGIVLVLSEGIFGCTQQLTALG